MGYALPAAIGVALQTTRPVVVVTGDGSIMMNLQELETISNLKLPIKILVISNGVYAIIRKRQLELFRGRSIGTDETNGVTCPDFEMVAKSFKLPFFRISPASDLESELSRVFASDGSALCEIISNPKQDYIRSGRIRTGSGLVVNTSLEDQLPLLDRKIIEQEMIIPLVEFHAEK